MILSKLSGGRILPETRTIRLLYVYSRNTSIQCNQTRLIFSHNPNQQKSLKILQNTPYHVQLNNIRKFKPINSFNAKVRFGEVALDRIAIGFSISICLFLILDFEFIFKLLPESVQKNMIKFKKRFVEICGKISRLEFKKADSLAANPTNGESSEDSDSQLENKSLMQSVLEHTKTNNLKNSSTFRDKRIIEYENRIRLYSNPDKIFRYFASIKINYRNGDSEIYMTPDDFLRALTPGIKQPDGLGLDQFKKIDMEKSDKNQFKFNLQPDSIFYKLSKYGLINFSDFLFLLTLLSVSQRHFEIAFRMFDLNGDGEVEYSEFEKVQNAILSQTSIGKKMGSSVRYKGISSAVSRYFFGPDLKNRLTTQTFVNFQQSLQYELLTLEFDRKRTSMNAYGNQDADERISEIDFADLLVAYANLSEKKRQRMIRRVMKKFSDNNSFGITKVEYLEFFRFLRNINDVDVALSVYNIAGASIDESTLKHVAHTVANVQLSDHIVNVVFTLFDDNDDGQLSNKEFVAVMKERLRRGLSKPKDTGFFKILYVMWRSIITFEF